MSTKSLWDKDIEDITFGDIEEFISLNLSEDQRPKEGVRLDYKSTNPNDLGKIITAFANTHGGIVIMGVREENNIPTQIVGITSPLGSDLKTMIANKIRSSVYPPPVVRIGITSMQANPSNFIAVIKVAEGEDPPYVWQHDGDKEDLYIRYGDTCRLATCSEIEALFKKKEEEQEGKSKKNVLITPSVYIPDKGVDLVNYSQTFYCMPLGNVTLMMDKQDEDGMYELIKATLRMLQYETGDKHIQSFIPHSSDCSYSNCKDGSIKINIGFSKNGEIGMATSLYSATLDRCDWSVIVRYAHNFLTIAEEFYKKYSYYGKVELMFTISTKELSIVDEENTLRHLKSNEFGLLNSMGVFYSKTLYTEELSNHNDFIAPILHRIMRELGYSYDYKKLLERLN